VTGRTLAGAGLTTLLLACSTQSGSRSTASDTGASASVPASFVNRVWRVAESPQVAVGEMRVFLSDSTLVMTSPGGTPAFGSWRVRDGQLSITEESREYPVDVLELGRDVFRIRIRGPGTPVEIRFTPAEQPAVPLRPAPQP
jgi:hypothetical protein